MLAMGDNGRGLEDAANKILARNEANNAERAKIRQVTFARCCHTIKKKQINILLER